MKKLILLAAAALLSMPLSFGQSKIKVNEESFLKKIEKSDADIANAKRATNPNTWLDRGKLFYDAETVVSKSILPGMTEIAGSLVFGPPTSRGEVVINDRQFIKLFYDPYLTVYTGPHGEFMSWETKPIIDDAIEKSVEAYGKAYELGEGKKSVNDKVAAGFKNNYDLLYSYASNQFVLGEYSKAADLFAKSYDLSQMPGFIDQNVTAEVVSALLYDSGMAYYFGKDYNKAIEYLTKAQEAGYENDGMVYQLLYYAYKDLHNAGDTEAMVKAKEVIEYGLGRYPQNPGIIGAATEAYIALDENPESIIPVVENAIADNPENPSLWNGLGMIYDSEGFKNYAKSAEAFEHVSQLLPNDFGAFFSAGLQYLKAGDGIINAANDDLSLSQEQLDIEIEKGRTYYRKGIPLLEKAHELNPRDINVLDLLKKTTFQLRDEPDMAEKSKVYDELYKQQSVQQQ